MKTIANWVVYDGDSEYKVSVKKSTVPLRQTSLEELRVECRGLSLRRAFTAMLD